MGFSRRRLCPLRRSLSGVVNASAREWKSSRHPNLSAPAVLGDALALWALCRSIFGWRRPPGRDCDSISRRPPSLPHFFLPLSDATMPSSSLPRLPIPMCPKEIRSFAPAMREYDSAGLLHVALPAATTAPFCKNSLRLILLSDLFMGSSSGPKLGSHFETKRRAFNSPDRSSSENACVSDSFRRNLNLFPTRDSTAICSAIRM